MKLFSFFLALLVLCITPSQGSFFKVPKDFIVYNYRFCKGNVDRVVSATLKKPLYKRCLKEGLKKLNSRKSRLHKIFAYQYLGREDITAKGSRGYSSETRDVLTYAIKRRLGMDRGAMNPLLSGQGGSISNIRQSFAEYCKAYGDYTLLAAINQGLTRQGGPTGVQSDDAILRNMIRVVDLYEVFPQLRELLIELSSKKRLKNPQDKRAYSGVKTFKKDVLRAMDKMVTLKRGLEKEGGGSKEYNEKLFTSINALGLLGQKYKKRFNDAYKRIDPTFKNEIPETLSQYKDLIFFTEIMRRINEFGLRCKANGVAQKRF